MEVTSYTPLEMVEVQETNTLSDFYKKADSFRKANENKEWMALFSQNEQLHVSLGKTALAGNCLRSAVVTLREEHAVFFDNLARDQALKAQSLKKFYEDFHAFQINLAKALRTRRKCRH